MRRLPWLLSLLTICAAATDASAQPVLIAKPDAFPTLVNPMCSHCRDEARRRAGELKADDRVLCWTRGYSDGGAIPFRFFLNPYRVISDTYGVFVADPDAGFARGFAPSLDFTFHGWRNGVVVLKDKDGTLYSGLTGRAFDGPSKGRRLEPVPTLVSDWGFWLRRYPGAVAYHMFDKYQPVELPAAVNDDSRKSRPTKGDDRLPADSFVLGVSHGEHARAYPLTTLEKAGIVRDEVAGQRWAVLWYGPTRTAAAYLSVATPPKKEAGAPRPLTLTADGKDGDAPFVDQETGSRWDIAGRATDGSLKGWTLTWLDGTQVKWFAWSAEYPETTVYGHSHTPGTKDAGGAAKTVAGTAEFLRGIPKRFATLRAVDAANHRVEVLAEGESTAQVWPLTPDAEVKVAGWWGRLDQLRLGDRVWLWFKTDRTKKPLAVCMLADELSEQDLHGAGVTIVSVAATGLTLRPAKGEPWTLTTDEAEVYRGEKKVAAGDLRAGEKVYVQSAGGKVRQILDPAAFEARRAGQRAALRKRWAEEGLPGTVTFLHVFNGEMELMLDHESKRWARSLQAGAAVHLDGATPIKAVVKQVGPWGERTRLRLVVHGLDQADLTIGERRRLRMPPPALAVDEAVEPPDLERTRTRDERIEWFLASIYCTCKIGGDGCTGHFYTLACCNPNTCGMPNRMRKTLADLIDQELTDRQIFDQLLRQHGPTLVRPHLLP